jgi:hypothetical protein
VNHRVAWIHLDSSIREQFQAQARARESGYGRFLASDILNEQERSVIITLLNS